MTKMSRAAALAALATTIASAATAQHSGPVSLELRTGAALPTADLGTTELDAGLTFELLLNVRLLPHLDIYGGWDWASFGMKEMVGAYDEIEENGYKFGARFMAPSIGALTPWIRAGGIYDHIELEVDDADDLVTGEHKLGWEAGAGAAIALGTQWILLPGARYRAFSPELDELGGTVDLNSLRIDLGFARTFGGPARDASSHH